MSLNFKLSSSFTQNVLSTGATPFAAVGDLNNDGISEVLIFRAHPLMWTNSWQSSPSKLDLVNLSSSSVNTYSLDNKLTLTNGIRLADFNNDGKLDVLLGDGGPDIVPAIGSNPLLVWSFNEQNQNPAILSLPAKTFSHQISTADINRDGNVDIFVGGNLVLGQSLSSLFVNNGGGSFSESNNLLPKYVVENTRISITSSTSYILNYTGATFLDVNRDGFSDLALFATSRNQDSIILLNNGGDFFGGKSITLPPGLYGKGFTLNSVDFPEQGTRNWTEAWSDVNLDGYPDLLLSQVLVDEIGGKSYWGGKLQLLINHEGKFFSDETTVLLKDSELPKQNGTNYFEPRFSDIDGDGDQDIVANYMLSNQQGGNRIFINDGSGKFSLSTSLTEAGWFIPIYANSDGSVDLLHFVDKIYGNDSLLGQSGKYGLFNRTFSIYLNTATELKLPGSIGMDKLRGDQNNNIFSPSLGDDLVDGGVGTDTVIFLGKLNDYILQSTYPQKIVIDKTLLRDGTDTLTNVERLQFTDTMLALDTGKDQTAGSGYMLYKAAFNRTPDAGGLGYWINQMDKGMSYSDVAKNFVNSTEFKTAFGGSNPTVNTLVTKLYNNVLNRTPDAGGLAFWQDKLTTGWSTADVLGYFSTSAENVTNVTPLIANGIPYQQFVG
jgi:hypothetical protein